MYNLCIQQTCDNVQAQNNQKWKKRSVRRKHRALAVVKRSQKNFAPPQTPFPGAQDGQNLITWDGHYIYLYLQTQFGEDRCTQFRVIVVTDPPTHPQTNRQDRLQYTAPWLASAQWWYLVVVLCSVYTTVSNNNNNNNTLGIGDALGTKNNNDDDNNNSSSYCSSK